MKAKNCHSRIFFQILCQCIQRMNGWIIIDDDDDDEPPRGGTTDGFIFTFARDNRRRFARVW